MDEEQGVDFEKADMLFRQYGINIWPSNTAFNLYKSESSWSSFVEDDIND